MNTFIEPDDNRASAPDSRRKNGVGGTGRVASQKTSASCSSAGWRLASLALVAAAWLGAGSAPVLAQATKHAAKKPFPTFNLPRRARGDEALQALGTRQAEVADWYGMTSDQFTHMLRHDRHAWLDRKGRLVFIDGFELPPEAIGEVASTANISGTVPAALDQTFQLHSRPNAKRVIYLDFNGDTVTGTAWNSSWSIAAINAGAYDIDGDPSTFSTTELQRIQYIWQRVAEDYAPFDVDVTTAEPPVEAMTRSSTSDDTFGTRVVITRDWTALTSSPCSCGGIAYVSAYDDTTEYYKPAWVFYNRLGSGNEKYVAEAISHEAGHNLGLSHDGFNDGATSLGYYAGHGSGATGWAPIMGVGYYKELTQWSKGEYAYATQTQDDLTVIQSRGAPLMADDHGNTAADATPMEASESGGILSLSASGLIGSRTDVDVFRFAIGAGNLSLNLSPGTRGPNLDISASLYDASGNLVATSNPADALSAGFSLNNLPGGTYYLMVDGTGKGDLGTGYSDYASLGEFLISGSAAASGDMPPVAAASATPTTGVGPLLVSFSSTGSHDPDGSALGYDWDFGDGSTHSSSANPSHTYAVGNYMARLTVTDVNGNADQATVNIAVTEPVMAPALHVDNIAMAASTSRKGIRATATVTVRDASGKLVGGARVQGAWSGAVSGRVSGTTTSKGTVKFTSAYSKTGGTFSFAVSNISLSGFVYDESQNKETSDSITR